MHRSAPLCRLSYGVDDVRVARAAAQVAAHALPDLDLGQVAPAEAPGNVQRGSARPAGLRLFNRGDAGHDLPRGTEAALKAVVLDECGLERMQLPIAFQCLDRRDVPTLLHD